jgi:KDO2-lipid IV(A) lauroyltransferase
MHWLQTPLHFLVLGLLRFFSVMPYVLTVHTGYALGSLAAHLPSERKRVVKTNLRLCFPQLSPAEIDALAVAHWRLLGRSVVERSRIWMGSPKQISAMVDIKAEIQLGDRKPRLLITPHFVGIEGGILALGVLALDRDLPKGTGLYQNMKNPFFNQKIIQWRERFGGRSIARQNRLRDLLREIRAGNFVFIAPDIDLGPKDSMFVPFFGISTNTVTSVSRLAKMAGAEVCLMVTVLKPDASGYICSISKPLEDFPSDDPIADTARLNCLYEQEIIKNPAEYYWIHKRFKHRPHGEPGLYSSK